MRSSRCTQVRARSFAIHRLITVEKRWITPNEAKTLLGFSLERDEGNSPPSSR